MSKILIVSKTKMENNVCVGGIDLDKSMSVRLLDSEGNHETKENCPYNIRDIWEIEYRQNPKRGLPFLEDVNVSSRERIEDLLQKLSMREALKEKNFPICQGSIQTAFEGKLKYTNNGALYISKEDIPKTSTCFWICDEELVRKDKEGKVRYNCDVPSHLHGRYYSIPFVGLEENPVQRIPQGTLIRLSLAHWLLHENEEKCFLQLSGWY